MMACASVRWRSASARSLVANSGIPGKSRRARASKLDASASGAPRKMIRAATLVLHVLSALQAKHRPRLRRCRRLSAHLLKYAANLVHLLGVRGRKLATLDEQTVLESDT